MRILEAIAAMAFLLLSLPVIVATWALLLVRGASPRLILVDMDEQLPSATYLMFNAREEDRVCCFLREAGLDLLPCFFSVVRGSIGFKDAVGLVQHIGLDRQGRKSVGSRFQEVLLFVVAILVICAAWSLSRV